MYDQIHIVCATLRYVGEEWIITKLQIHIKCMVLHMKTLGPWRHQDTESICALLDFVRVTGVGNIWACKSRDTQIHLE